VRCSGRAHADGIDDGCFVLRSPEALQPYARCVGEWLEQWAAATPDAPAFAERTAAGWTRLSWRQAREQVGRIAQGLLDRKLPAGAPVVVLSDNALEHLLLALAAMHVGIPVCTVSSAYCRMTKDHGKVHGILQSLRPALVYASDAAVYGAGRRRQRPRCPVVFGRGTTPTPGRCRSPRWWRRRKGRA
jgi:feruloyl-CoA synthase